MQIKTTSALQYFATSILCGITCLMCFSSFQVVAQNLAPNPSFEFYTDCPSNINIDLVMECVPWQCASVGTSDYFNACAITNVIDVPKNFFGFEYAYDGSGYCGFFAKDATPGGDYREYVQAPLLSPLIAGHNYHVSFYVSLSNNYCAVQLLGAYFSKSLPVANMAHPLNYTPQIESPGGFLNDTINWMLVEGCFIAEGGEKYITIGNYHANSETPLDPMCGGTMQTSSYYYLDMVTVEDAPTVQLDLELGGPVSVCNSYTIDPGLSGVHYLWEDGSTDPTLTVFSSGTYSLTIYDGCDAGEDSIEVNIIEQPPIELNPDEVTICQGEEYIVTLDPTVGEYTWSDGTVSPVYSISTPGEYIVSFDDGCDITSDGIIVNVLDAPLPFSLGNDTILCEGTFIDYSFNPELGEFHWSDNSTANTFSIGIAGEYSLTISNACSAEEDFIEVTAFPSPQFELGNPINGCPGDTFILSASVPSGMYLWQNGSINDSFPVTNSGMYVLQVSNECGSYTDTLIATFGSTIAQPSLGPDTNLCPGESIILATGNNGVNTLWQDLSTADTLLVNAPGMYYVTVSNTCFTYTDSVLIGLNILPPDLNLPDTILLCQGSTLIIDAGITGVSYEWSDHSQNSMLSVSATGTYSLTVRNACGSDQDSVIVQDGGAAPVVSLGPDQAICADATIVLTPFFENVDQWLWSDGSTDPELMIQDSGRVTIIAQNDCGVSYDTLHIGLLESIPELYLGNDTSLCAGQTFILNIIIPNVSITWPDGSSMSSFVVDQTGEIIGSISNACGSSSDTILVESLAPIPILDLGADLPLCPGELIIIDPGIPDVAYLWSDGSDSNTLTVDHDESVALTISNSCGTAIDTVEIFTSMNGPDVDLGPDILACEGTIVTISSNIAGVNYIWQDGSSDDSFTTSQSGEFYLDVSNACGFDSDTIHVDIHGNAPQVNLGADTLLCEGEGLTLQVLPDNETTITWQDGSTLSSYLINVAGIYSVHELNRCGDARDTIEIAYQVLPTPVNLGTDLSLCNGDSVVLHAPLTTDILTWQDGSHMDSYLVTQEGSYGLTVTNDCGTEQDEIEVNYNHELITIPFVEPADICPGDIVHLDVIQPFDASYLWSTGASTSEINAGLPGTYFVTITTSCQTAVGKFEIFESESCKSHNDFYIPNVITPNGDHINDVFSIFPGSEVNLISMNVSIFDRWGNMVFNSALNPFIWDGTFKGDILQPAVFVYKIHVRYVLNGEEIEEDFSGDVTIVK